jgi:hypothetical protein
MLKRVLLVLSGLAFSSAIAVAAETSNEITTITGGKITVTAPTADHSRSNWYALVPAGTKPAFSNLDTKYPDGTYFCCHSYTISGPTSTLGKIYGGAAGFKPSATATVSEIALGLGYTSGTNEVMVTLNADNAGVPGKVLASGKATSLPALGSCCVLSHVRFKGVALTAGTQYWVAVFTLKSDANTLAGWNMNDTEEVSEIPCALYTTTAGTAGWTAGGCLGPAFAVY